MKLKIFLLLFISLYIVNCTLYNSHATIRYVSKTGTSAPPYTSWETAADSIQKAITESWIGDTVIVANGIYTEKLVINRFIYLIGLSQDSCVIDGSNEMSEEVIRCDSHLRIENFTIKSRGQNLPTDCVSVNFGNITMSNCSIKDARNGIILGQSSSLIQSCIFINCRKSINTICPIDTCRGTYLNNIIISQNSSDPAILHFFGGSSVTNHNLIFGLGSSQIGVSFESQKRVEFRNNLISGFQNINVSVSSHSDTVFLINNNSMNVQNASAFNINQGDKNVLRNNIIQNANTGVSGFFNPVSVDYNLFNNVTNIVSSGAYLGEGNVFVDPMFVNDTLPTLNGSYNLHLQKYSPAIDAGDPNILDVDGTRSDIGMFGGPDGELYEYLDLAPRTPKNFTYSFDTTSNFLTLNWNMNTEYDFRNYNVYRDTVSGFTPSENNLVTQTDTSYFADNLSNIKSSSVYYRVTAVDSQDNESQPGNQIAVIITGIEPEVEILRDYILHQNYPNPFNPSTLISYEIKERAYVKLMVYDIKGELVSVLVNKEQTAGFYEVEFSTIGHSSASGGLSGISDLASGIYLYRIEVIGEGQIPTFSDMKKMVLLK